MKQMPKNSSRAMKKITYRFAAGFKYGSILGSGQSFFFA